MTIMSVLVRDDATPTMADFRYSAYLSERLADLRDARKTERTRVRLELAATELLETRLYDDLTVAEITRRAQVAHGTFYRYFENRRAIVLAVMRGSSRSILDLRPRGAAKSAFDAVRRMNRFYVDYYRQNVGLMRSYVRLKTEDAEFAAIGQEADRWLAVRVLRDVEMREPDIVQLPVDIRRLVVYAVMGMVDEMLRKVYCGTDPAVTGYADRTDVIAEVLSAVWWRALYGALPQGEAFEGSDIEPVLNLLASSDGR